MTENAPVPTTPANEALRRPAPNVIDQRQQQIDPAGHHRVDDNARPDSNRKQPGGTGPDDGGGS
jgi:hypothetical protein